MLKKVYRNTIFGIEATKTIVEVNIAKGIDYYFVGLPDNVIRENNYRITSTLQNINYKTTLFIIETDFDNQ
ncbi:hypothetical protein [uncultured Kordia sp.]|uniref:hypothetical protein n=1 Tax=uncultured Kordia sp. TaxID=507699 RepID=UPI002628BEB9|nr:hypothetical protein [uncultured Kordia sp.]